MKFLPAALVILATGVGAARSAPAEGPARTFRPIDLFALQYASDPQVRPDGGDIAYVRNAYDIMVDRAQRTIWLVDPASGAQTPLGGAGSQSQPRWSPDGKRLAFVCGAEGEKPQLCVRWMASGQTARIASLPDAPRSLAWSPDGRFIAFSMFVADEPMKFGAPIEEPEGAKWADPLQIISAVTYRHDDEGYAKPGFFHVFVVASDGGAARQLTFGAFDDRGGLSWSADSGFVVFSGNRGPNWEREPRESDVFRVGLADGTLTQLTHRYGPNGQPQVSPDGRLIAYVGFNDRHRGYENVQLYVMDADGANSRSLTESLDRSVAAPRWSADGKSILVSYVDKGVSRIARVGLDGKITQVAQGMNGMEPDRPYTGGEYSLAANGLVAFTQGAPDEAGDIAIASGGKTTRLTRLNEALLFGKTLAKVEPMAVTSSVDGLPIDAWLMTPPGFDPARKYPLILEIHGGPYASYGPVFGSELQLYAAAGYVVVYANPRGSTSYGFSFADQINDNYPSHDYDDLMSVVDAAINKGFVDKDNLFVTGGSGGGLLTAWIVGKTARFKAAVAQKPVINWTSEVLTVDEYIGQAVEWFGKAPWEDYEQYWRRSPLSLVGNVSTPTMLMVGTEDRRTPGSEAEQFYQALQMRKVPTLLVRVPGASHHALAERPSQEAAETAATLAWFGRYRSSPPAS
jgi:dipeptidyl aminopeptidase/acylaminoacyl peptidase